MGGRELLQRESALRLRAPASPFVGAILTSSRYRRARERERGGGGKSAGGRGRGSPSIPDSSSSVLNSDARLTEGRKDRRHHHHHPAVSLLLSRSAASSPAVKMHRHRPAQGLALFLPVALWICSHVRGAHGALPTTRKLLFLIFVVVAVDDDDALPAAEADILGDVLEVDQARL